MVKRKLKTMKSILKYFTVFYITVVNVQLSNGMNTARCYPPDKVNCETIIEFMNCNGYKVKDCLFAPQSKSDLWKIDDLLAWDYGVAACRLFPNGDMASLQNFDEISAVQGFGMVNRVTSTYQQFGMKCDATYPVTTCNLSNLTWVDGSSTDYIFKRLKSGITPMTSITPNSYLQAMTSGSMVTLMFMPSSAASTVCKVQTSEPEYTNEKKNIQSSAEEVTSVCDKIIEHFRKLNVPVFDCFVNQHKNRAYWRIDPPSSGITPTYLTWQFGKAFCRSMPTSEMVTVHNFEDWQTTAALSSTASSMGSFSVVGLIGEGKTHSVRWIDGTPFDYNTTQTQIPFGYPLGTEGDFCGYLMPSLSSQFQFSLCNQTYPAYSAVCSMPIGKEEEQEEQLMMMSSDDKSAVDPKSCPQPEQPLMCSAVIKYLRCLGYSVFDCTERNGNVYYKINLMPQMFNMAHLSCEMIDGGNAISVHNTEEAVILHWMACSGDASAGVTQSFIGLKCSQAKCKESSLVWSDGTPYDYKLINNAYLNKNDTDKRCFTTICNSTPMPTPCNDDAYISVICKAGKNQQKY